MNDLPAGTAVFETDFANEARFYAKRLGPDFCVTGGVDTLYAVRKVCGHPVKDVRANGEGKPECGLCLQTITEPSTPVERVGLRLVERLIGSLPHGGSGDL